MTDSISIINLVKKFPIPWTIAYDELEDAWYVFDRDEYVVFIADDDFIVDGIAHLVNTSPIALHLSKQNKEEE